MELLTYKKFYEKEHVVAITQALSDNGIEFEVTEHRENLDVLYGAKHFNHQFFIKLRGDDFARADAALLKLSEAEIETVGKDHYLYAFTDEELFDILSKPDEWNEFDYLLSKKILEERGKEINNNTIDLLKKQRIKELAKPEESQKTWIYAGYFFSMLGGLLGIFIGWHLSSFKKTLPNGQQIYAHSDADRKHGRRILVLGLIMLIISLIIRITTTEY